MALGGLALLLLVSLASAQFGGPTRGVGMGRRGADASRRTLRPLADYEDSALVTIYVHPGNVRAEVYRDDELVATPEPRGPTRSTFMVRFFDIHPQGETVVFLLSREGYRYARVLVPIQRDSLRVLGVILASEFEADRILYETPGVGGSAIGACLPDGSERTLLVDTPEPDTEPAVAPDGLRVAFASGEVGGRRIMILDRRTGGVVVAVSAPGADYSCPGWLDDRRLVVLREEGGRAGIEVHDLEAGSRQAMPETGQVRTPAPDPARARVLFSTNAYDAGWDIAEWEPATGAIRRVTALEGDEWAPVANPTDGRVAYIRAAGDGTPPVLATTSDLPGVGRTSEVLRYGAVEAAYSADGSVLVALDAQGVAVRPEGASWWGHPLSREVALGGLAWGRLARLDEDPVLVVVETETGNSLIRVDRSSQPETARHFLSLLDAGFYDGTRVHRVVPGMVVQFGCPWGNGTGGAGPALPAEPSPLTLSRGRVAMEPEGDGLASSRLLVALDDLTELRHPGAFGTVIRGMEAWDRVLPGDQVRRAYRLRFDEADFGSP